MRIAPPIGGCRMTRVLLLLLLLLVCFMM